MKAEVDARTIAIVFDTMNALKEVLYMPQNRATFVFAILYGTSW